MCQYEAQCIKDLLKTDSINSLSFYYQLLWSHTSFTGLYLLQPNNLNLEVLKLVSINFIYILELKEVIIS